MATSYEGFAYLYDQFMNNIPYDDWSHYLLSLLEQLLVGTVCAIFV